MVARDPHHRHVHAQLAANMRWANEDPNAEDGPLRRARAKAEARYYEQTDPSLPEAERQRRSANLRAAHYARMHLRSLASRRAKAAERRPTAGGGA